MSPIAFVLIVWWSSGSMGTTMGMTTAVFADEKACNLALYEIRRYQPNVVGICTRQETPQ